MKIKNLVFEGGGILGISYLGALDYLYSHNLVKDVERVAGTSVGAITALLLSLNLTFEEISRITNSIEYGKIKEQNTIMNKTKIGKMINNVGSLYRLVNIFIIGLENKLRINLTLQKRNHLIHLRILKMFLFIKIINHS